MPGEIIPKGFKRNGEINDCDINKAIKLIEDSERPLLYVGGGAISSGAPEDIAPPPTYKRGLSESSINLIALLISQSLISPFLLKPLGIISPGKTLW